MSLTDIINSSLRESVEVNSSSEIDNEFITNLETASKLLIDSFENKGKLMLAGNGGSAADSQHINCRIYWKINF